MNGHASDALERFWKVRTTFDPEPVLALALEKGLAANKSQGYDSINSVLQILCSHAESPHLGTPFVFASGEIYSMYEALRLQYSAYFDDWCLEEFGVSHHHLLLRDVPTMQPDVQSGMVYTLGQLEGQFSSELTQSLCQWLGRHDNGNYRPCALIWGKSWKHEQFFLSARGVTALCDRWNHYVE